MLNLKNKLKKWLPTVEAVKNQPGLRWLDFLLHQHHLWHFNKRTVAAGFAAGLLVAFVPLPFQMILAALFAILFRGNIPVAAATTWISNPLTFIPITALIIKVGSLITGATATTAMTAQEFHWNLNSLLDAKQLLAMFGKNFLVGLPIVSVTAAIVGYLLVRFIWRLAVIIKKSKKHQ